MSSICMNYRQKISTHTSRVGCDGDAIVPNPVILISTHTSRVGCDFLRSNRENSRGNFYSHIPCGMWLLQRKQFKKVKWISTHTSRVGCDNVIELPDESIKISTHTSRVGCDPGLLSFESLSSNFYSHIPCGMWPGYMDYLHRQKNFYSHIPCGMWRNNGRRRRNKVHWFLLTHPVWDVTSNNQQRNTGKDISTHTSRVGCDREFVELLEQLTDFYSHIPCGMWRQTDVWSMGEHDFYSHIPCGMWRVRWTNMQQ